MNKLQSNKQLDLAYLKVVAILLVVIGHSNYYKMGSFMGGIDYSSTYVMNSTIYRLVDFIVSTIYLFHMPLFVFIAGALYYFGNVQQNKNYKFVNLIKNKFIRLIIPYFCIGLLYMIPIKLLTNFYQIGNLPKIIFYGIFLGLGSGHLWFIFMLFNLFIVFYMIEKKLNKINISINLLFLFILYYFSYKIPLNIFNIIEVSRHLIFFYLGYLFQKRKEHILILFGKNKFLSFLGVFTYFMIINYFFRDPISMPSGAGHALFRELLLLLVSLLGILSTYLFINCIIEFKISNNKFTNLLDKYNFDIYLFHDPINYIILAIFFKYKLFSLFSKASYNSLLIVSLRIIIPIILSIIIAFLVNKIRMKYTVK